MTKGLGEGEENSRSSLFPISVAEEEGGGSTLFPDTEADGGQSLEVSSTQQRGWGESKGEVLAGAARNLETWSSKLTSEVRRSLESGRNIRSQKGRRTEQVGKLMGPHTALSQKGPRVCWLQGLRPPGRHPRLRHSQRGPDVSPYPVRLKSKDRGRREDGAWVGGGA